MCLGTSMVIQELYSPRSHRDKEEHRENKNKFEIRRLKSEIPAP